MEELLSFAFRQFVLSFEDQIAKTRQNDNPKIQVKKRQAHTNLPFLFFCLVNDEQESVAFEPPRVFLLFLINKNHLQGQ